MKEGIILELNKNTAVLITAGGEFLSIPSQPTWSIGDEIKYNPRVIDSVSTNKSSRKNFLMKKGVWIALAASLMLLFIPLSTLTEASSYVTIDINPSIELELKGDKVINVIALNNDGEKVILNMPKEYQDIYSITTYIIDKSKELGYLAINEDNYIMIGLCENNTSFSITEYENFIEEKLAEQQLEANVSFLEGTAEEKRLADNKNLSLGKYLFQQNRKSEGIEISDNDLLNGTYKNMYPSEKVNLNSDNKSNSEKIKSPNNKDNNVNTNIPNNSEPTNKKNLPNNPVNNGNGEVTAPALGTNENINGNPNGNINENLNETINDNNMTPPNNKSGYNSQTEVKTPNVNNSTMDSKVKNNN